MYGRAGLRIGWEDASLHELAASGHQLVPSLTAAIMGLARKRAVSGEGAKVQGLQPVSSDLESAVRVNLSGFRLKGSREAFAMTLSRDVPPDCKCPVVGLFYP